MSAFLFGCAKPSSVRIDCNPFLNPTTIDGVFQSQKDVARDPEATTRDLINHGGAADDALSRSNADKASCKRLLEGATK